LHRFPNCRRDGLSEGEVSGGVKLAT
jgi:hypothetical protein